VRLVRNSPWPSAKVVVQAESAEAVRNIDNAGIFGMTPERAAAYVDRGHRWLVTGIDRPA